MASKRSLCSVVVLSLLALLISTLLVVTSGTTLTKADDEGSRPDRPANAWPADRAVAVTLTPTLQSSAFSDRDAGDSHAASWWQITTAAGRYHRPMFDSGRDTANLTNLVLLPGILKPNTKYYWHVQHMDSRENWSRWSAETSFTTVSSPSDATPPVAVTDLAATTATSSSMTLTWTSPGDDDDTGTASSYDIRYSTTAITDDTWGAATRCNGVPVPKVSGSPETFTGTGLSPNTLYFFAIKSADEVANWSGLSNIASKKTELAGTLPPTVSTIPAAEVGATSAVLRGNLASPGTASSVQVVFEWGLTTSYGSLTAPQVMTATGMFSASLASLTPKVTYHFRAKAVGDGSTYGDDLTLATLASDTAPSVITSGTSSLAVTSVTLNGILTSLGSAANVKVSFEWGTTASYGSETSSQAMSSVGAFSANLTGLSADSTYHFQAKATSDGSAVYGEVVTFATASPDTTAPVIELQYRAITATGATITWTTNEPATSQVEYGLTEEYGSASALDTSLVTRHSVDLTNLKAGKTYHYRVMSKDDSGNQAVSVDAVFTTDTRSGGQTPTWVSVVIVLAVIGVGGSAIHLMFKSEKSAKSSPAQSGS
jgi:hypothetical protein